MKAQHQIKLKTCLLFILLSVCSISFIFSIVNIDGGKTDVKVFGKHENFLRMSKTKLDDKSFVNNSACEDSVHSDDQVGKLYRLVVDKKCDRPCGSIEQKQEDTWQEVDIVKSMYVFSSYYIEKKRRVYIIGVKPRKKVSVTCQLWMDLGDQTLVLLQQTSAAIGAPEEGNGQRYTSTIFVCQVYGRHIPTHVSLVTRTCESPLNLLAVKNASRSSNYPRRFTVCLSPLNFRYGRAYELVEWIELNRILGADYFVVYNYSSASNVQQVLEYYTRRGIVEVIQWRLPMGANTFPKTNVPIEIHYFGQTAALNDCLFRNKQYSEFVVNVDVDEFIIPHSNTTLNWVGMLEQLDTRSTYIIRNVFFRKDWKRKNTSFAGKNIVAQLRLVSLQVFQRETKIFPAGLRSKYIVRTKDVELILTHIVPHGHKLIVPPEVAMLHHYRNWESPNDKKERVVDKTVLQKFKHTLIENTKHIWKDLEYVEMDVPVV